MSEKPSRKHQILEALAHELESKPGTRITTAKLAEAVGVSEAALYRHFPSKAKMFEGLIEFAEESVFGLIRRILDEEKDGMRRCENIMVLMLGFSERNPGITRVLLGDALVGEHERLQQRVMMFFNKLETQIKQVLREGEAGRDLSLSGSAASVSQLLIAVTQGKMVQYTHSKFNRKPLDDWSIQWPLLAASFFKE
jgi:TetR/AcrR family transcriptional regulator